MRHPRRVFPVRPARPAFTLIELMISIALVALLILGVNQVFLYTSQAVGTGEAINDAVRSGRSIQKTMGDDLLAAVPNGLDADSSAGFVIASTSVFAFRDAADLTSDIDANPATFDLDGDGIEGDAPGETISPLTYNFRNHRTDTLSFFARGHYSRQTAGSPAVAVPPFVSNMQSTEAWVWYGHLQLPDNTVPPSAAADFFGPGAGTSGSTPSPAVNPNNIFSSQFVLGREAILLRAQQPSTSGGSYTPAGASTSIYDTQQSTRTAQYFIPKSSYSLTTANDPKWPFSSGLTSADGYTLNQSRYDLAAGTISQLQQSLTAWIQAYPGTAIYWWTKPYYNQTFQCNPFVTKPLTPVSMAQASPYFARGVSQFIVEFAGDFVTQNNYPTDTTYNDTTGALPAEQLQAYVVKPKDGTYGDVIADGGDGVVDFFIDKGADPNYPSNPAAQNPALWQRRVRWYGLPRDDNGDGVINGWGNTVNSTAAAVAARSNNDLLDVVPVRDVVGTTVHPELLPTSQHGSPTAYKGENFEWFPSPDQSQATGSTNPITKSYTNYATITPSTPANGTGATLAAYTAAFGPFDPRVKFIRVTITLDDPSGRLRDGQTFQYVFPVGAK